VQEAVAEKRWDIWVALREDTQQLIGTLVRRHIQDLQINAARWPKAGVVDYFCVHPAWRSKGVGRQLLILLHNSTPAPIPPHLMFWEQGIRLDVPCFSAGIFWARKISKSSTQVWQPIQDPQERERLWSSCNQSSSINAKGGWKETTVWRGPEGSVAIWDTFHTTVPECEKLGIVVGATSDLALIAFCKAGAGPFGVLLKPADSIQVPEGWEYDAAYAWFAYNTLLGLNPTSIVGTFPCISF
jgi:GNAT superfamily N-acetyltransferase